MSKPGTTGKTISVGRAQTIIAMGMRGNAIDIFREAADCCDEMALVFSDDISGPEACRLLAETFRKIAHNLEKARQ